MSDFNEQTERAAYEKEFGVINVNANSPRRLAHEENARLREALRQIAEHPHCIYGGTGEQQYEIGVVDGHRCAANIARAALAPKEGNHDATE